MTGHRGALLWSVGTCAPRHSEPASPCLPRGLPPNRGVDTRTAEARGVCDAPAHARPRTASPPGEPGQRRERQPLHPARGHRRLDLVLELPHEQREIERPGDAAAHRAPLLGESDRRLEQALHLEGGSHLDVHDGVASPAVAEACGTAAGITATSPGTAGPPPPPPPEGQLPFPPPQALPPQRVDLHPP